LRGVSLRCSHDHPSTLPFHITLPRYRDPFDPGGQFDPLVDGLEIDDGTKLIAHRQNPGPSSHGRIGSHRHRGACKVFHLPQVVDLPDRLHPGYPNTADFEPLDGKRVALAVGGEEAGAPVHADPTAIEVVAMESVPEGAGVLATTIATSPRTTTPSSADTQERERCIIRYSSCTVW
jgi:hypothetical protein